MKITTLTVDEHLAPADCQTMADVRQGVDALDRALVQLLTERQGFMDAAARIKADRNKVFDRARIEDVVEKVMLRDTVDKEFTTTDEIADTAVFLAGQKTLALTGQSILVSHGLVME